MSPWQKHLADSVDELYPTVRKEMRDELAQIFLDAEQAYFRHLPARMSGTISMEPLVSDKPGPPIYLTKRLSREQRAAYAAELTGIKSRAEKLLRDVPQASRPKFETVIRCMGNVLKDVGT
jgi:CTP:molybdopterin cytidylyltransferase MocA